ncbi:MAG TPA: glycosyltransferase family 2 protein, partial [Lachnospiraceae bacterium]|nr:glycosyltransferase family 2 protein [Lachnospiraceae bacterium]
MKDRILLFIPAYNCQKQIIRVLGQLDADLMHYITGVIVVNNRSTDDTELVVKGFMERHPDIPVTLLRNKENYGLGGSHKVAFSYAAEHTYDYVIVLHGDDQGTLEDFLPVLKSRYYTKHDCILGARFMRGSRLEGYSVFRTFGNIVYNFLFAAVVRRRIFDLGSGLNMYSMKMLREAYYEKFPDNLMFNYCMILAGEYYRQDIRFYPVSWREEDQVSNVRMINQAMTVLKMLFDYYR